MMNHKINFLKFFFDADKYLEESSLSAKVTDLLPAIIYVYDVESKKLRLVNQKFTEYFGLTYEDVKDSENLIFDIVYKDDVELVKRELHKFYTENESDTLSFQCRLNCREDDWK